MIKEAYCSFEVSKLLKEKGFDEKCSRWYVANEPQEGIVEKGFGENQFYINAPTHQMAMAWMREAHSIFIIIKPHDSLFDDEYEFSICKKQNTVIFEWELLEIENSLYEGYEETVEAALKYTLENVI